MLIQLDTAPFFLGQPLLDDIFHHGFNGLLDIAGSLGTGLSKVHLSYPPNYMMESSELGGLLLADLPLMLEV